jgi:hypothetical protein
MHRLRGGGFGLDISSVIRAHGIVGVCIAFGFLAEACGFPPPLIGFASTVVDWEASAFTSFLLTMVAQFMIPLSVLELAVADNASLHRVFIIYHLGLFTTYLSMLLSHGKGLFFLYPTIIGIFGAAAILAVAGPISAPATNIVSTFEPEVPLFILKRDDGPTSS